MNLVEDQKPSNKPELGYGVPFMLNVEYHRLLSCRSGPLSFPALVRSQFMIPQNHTVVPQHNQIPGSVVS
jgi:hypothetical protein